MEVALLEQEFHQEPVDLTQLIGGEQFLVECGVHWKGNAMTFQCLVDTGANAYALINQKHVRPLTRVLHMPVYTLPDPVPLRGFDGQPSKAVRQVVIADLEIDQHLQTRQYFLSADLGSHDIILGRKWLAKHGVLPDCRQNQLRWPGDTTTRVLKRTSVEEPEGDRTVPLAPPRDLLTRKAEY
jgi:predicted aspartyl protease